MNRLAPGGAQTAQHSPMETASETENAKLRCPGRLVIHTRVCDQHSDEEDERARQTRQFLSLRIGYTSHFD